jgi:hypothetical protein
LSLCTNPAVGCFFLTLFNGSLGFKLGFAFFLAVSVFLFLFLFVLVFTVISGRNVSYERKLGRNVSYEMVLNLATMYSLEHRRV